MDFVIIANAWTAAADNPTSKHQIAMELVRQGHRVLWVVGAGMRTPSLGSGADRGRMLRKLRGALRRPQEITAADALPGHGALWVTAPLLIPLPGSAAVRRFNGMLFCAISRFWSRRLGLDQAILINYVPVLAGAMRGWPGRTVYHCVDRWDQFTMYDRDLMRKMDAACHRHADVVIATSRELYTHCSADHDTVHLINHGVSYAHFSQALQLRSAPAPFAHRGGPVIGFFGLLSEWVDQPLLLALARACPQVDLVLIGSADVEVSALKSEPNIHVLGPKPFAELPAYIAHFDVGIIPFVVNELTLAVNPIKLREMLAAGCPVVSTALPEVSAYVEGGAGAVQVADSEATFIAAVQASLTNSHVRASISESMKHETWQAKVHEMIAVMNPSTAQEKT